MCKAECLIRCVLQYIWSITYILNFFLNVCTKMLVIYKYTYTFMFKSAYVYGFPLAIQIKTFWNVNREMRVAEPVLMH